MGKINTVFIRVGWAVWSRVEPCVKQPCHALMFSCSVARASGSGSILHATGRVYCRWHGCSLWATGLNSASQSLLSKCCPSLLLGLDHGRAHLVCSNWLLNFKFAGPRLGLLPCSFNTQNMGDLGESRFTGRRGVEARLLWAERWLRSWGMQVTWTFFNDGKMRFEKVFRHCSYIRVDMMGCFPFPSSLPPTHLLYYCSFIIK